MPLKFKTRLHTPENIVDCAIAEVSNPSMVSSKIAILGNIKGVHPPILGETSQKCGRTSELISGIITSVGDTILLNFKTGKCLFKDQIGLTKMSEQGDSGAILLDLNNYAIGMLIGTSNTTCLFNSIDTILSNLHVHIVTGN